MNRRNFLKGSFLASFTAFFSPIFSKPILNFKPFLKKKYPLVISTWNHGLKANEKAWSVLENNGNSLDAVQFGVMVSESDPNCTSVGYGGYPDALGQVTLDACIMNHKGNCGSVSFLRNIKNPISVARKVMEETPHVMLSGKGAYDFAIKKGFKKENLLTLKAKKAWIEWKKNKKVFNNENHDTIGMLAIDNNGNISGACTTSGLAWKLHGRVGDSPIIGAGMYVDNDIGGACATGVGECVMKSLGSFLIVELMRSGMSPQEACEEAIKRILKKQILKKNVQVGYLAINKYGETGAFSIKKGFEYALFQNKKNVLLKSQYIKK